MYDGYKFTLSGNQRKYEKEYTISIKVDDHMDGSEWKKTMQIRFLHRDYQKHVWRAGENVKQMNDKLKKNLPKDGYITIHRPGKEPKEYRYYGMYTNIYFQPH